MIAARRSVPPVVPPPRNTRPIPTPCRMPPYNAARKISSDSFHAGRTASHTVREISPIRAFFTNENPFIFAARINTGTFSTRFVTQSGTPFPYKPFVPALTMIAMPENPPVTIPAASKQEVIAVAIRPVPMMISRYSRYHGFLPVIFILKFSLLLPCRCTVIKYPLTQKNGTQRFNCFPFLVCPIWKADLQI